MALWSTGRELINTKLFEADGDGDAMPAYLMDLREHKGTWLMTLWNEVNRATDGSIASVVATEWLQITTAGPSAAASWDWLSIATTSIVVQLESVAVESRLVVALRDLRIPKTDCAGIK
jgi:hypothetical protein